MIRTQVQQFVSVGIIYKEADPKVFLADIKTTRPYAGIATLPDSIWSDKESTKDQNPFETYKRTIKNKISFKRAAKKPGGGDRIVAEEKDHLKLCSVVDYIANEAILLGSFLVKTSKDFFNKNNQEKTTKDLIELFSVFQTPLPPREWATLEALQEKYKSLYSDSLSLIKNANKAIFLAPAYKKIMQIFYESKSFVKEAAEMETNQAEIEKIPFCSSYKEYMQIYQINKIPEVITKPD